MTQDLQRIQIKIPSVAPPDLNLDPFVEIFARWRLDKKHPAEWLDVADYAHVVRGPGIVLVGLRSNFSFDLAAPAPGILFAARKGLTGSAAERILSALRWCLELSQRLATENEFPAAARLRTDSLVLRFNDRLDTPNTFETDQALRPAVTQALDALYGAGTYELIPEGDPKECYGFSVRARAAESLEALLARLAQVHS